MGRKRIAAVVSHPIQYQAPLFRQLAERSEFDLTVYFENDHGVQESLDPGFGQSIRFDVPLTEGFDHEFLTTGKGFDRSTAMLARGLGRLVQEIRQQHFDWVWVHGYSSSVTLTAILAARACGIPVLLRGESTMLYPLPRERQWIKDGCINALVRNCRAFGYIGTQNRDFYLRYGAPQEQLFYAPYSIDNQRFAHEAAEANASGAAAKLRRRLGLSDDQKLCLFVGKLIPRKRPLDIIHALRRLSTEYAVLYLGDGVLRGETEKEIACSGVLGHVEGFVNQSKLATYYAAADMLVLPSEQETWGLVANEAMACGKPIVVSSLVGSSYDLADKDNGTGYSYPCGDVAALSDAIETVGASLRNDPDGVRRRVSKLIASFDITATVRGLSDAFLSVAR